MQVAREIVLAKERYGAAVELKEITINSKPATLDVLKALLDSLHTPARDVRAAHATSRSQQEATPAPEVSTANVTPSTESGAVVISGSLL